MEYARSSERRSWRSRPTGAGRSLTLESVGTHLAGPDPEHLFDGRHPDLAVADLAGAGGLRERVDDAVHLLVVAKHLDLDLRDEVDLVLGAPVDLGVPALPPEPLDVGRGEPVHAQVLQRLLDLVEPMRFDDRDDELHGAPECVDAPSLARERRARADPRHSSLVTHRTPSCAARTSSPPRPASPWASWSVAWRRFAWRLPRPASSPWPPRPRPCGPPSGPRPARAPPRRVPRSVRRRASSRRSRASPRDRRP